MIFECFIHNFDGNIPFFYLDQRALVYLNYQRDDFELIYVNYAGKELNINLYEIMTDKPANFHQAT